MADWESQIAGERMAVDGEFSDRVTASSLSSQQWNLVMTAVNFEIENPRTPAEATLVADTTHLSSISDELESVGNASPMGPGGGGSSGSDGILSGVLSSLGMGSGDGDALIDEAADLADEYAEQLQAKLVENGRWEAICERAASG